MTRALVAGGLIAACVAVGRPAAGRRAHGWRRITPELSCFFRRIGCVLCVRRKCVRRWNVLGLPPDRLVLLGEPDTAAPHEGPELGAVVEKLICLIDHEPFVHQHPRIMAIRSALRP